MGSTAEANDFDQRSSISLLQWSLFGFFAFSCTNELSLLWRGKASADYILLEGIGLEALFYPLLLALVCLDGATAWWVLGRRLVAFWTGQASLALSLLFTLRAFYETAANTEKVRRYYEHSRAARGLPIDSRKLDAIFSSTGIFVTFGGLVLLLLVASGLLMVLYRQEVLARVRGLVRRREKPAGPPPHPWMQGGEFQKRAPLPEVRVEKGEQALRGPHGWVNVLILWLFPGSLISALAQLALLRLAPMNILLIPLLWLSLSAVLGLSKGHGEKGVKRTKLFLVYYLCQPLVWILISHFLGIRFVDGRTSIPDGMGVVMLWRLLNTAGWWAYLLKSERVRVTYLTPPDAKTPRIRTMASRPLEPPRPESGA